MEVPSVIVQCVSAAGDFGGDVKWFLRLKESEMLLGKEIGKTSVRQLIRSTVALCRSEIFETYFLRVGVTVITIFIGLDGHAVVTTLFPRMAIPFGQAR